MIEPKLDSILRKHLKYLSAERALGQEDDLKVLGLDSMAAIDLLLDIEDQFGITLPDHYLTEGAFSTPASLHQVLKQLGSGSAHVG